MVSATIFLVYQNYNIKHKEAPALDTSFAESMAGAPNSFSASLNQGENGTIKEAGDAVFTIYTIHN